MTTTGVSGSEFEYRDWLVRVETTGAGEAFSGHADLYLQSEHLCRVVLSTSRLDRPSAHAALCTKARVFIDEWALRDHTGNTDFQDL